jgi:hypothetical protein
MITDITPAETQALDAFLAMGAQQRSDFIAYVLGHEPAVFAAAHAWAMERDAALARYRADNAVEA